MKLLEPITVGGITIKNRIMFPPLTTGYEDRNGNITPRSCAFYERLAKGGTGYIVVGDVNPIPGFSPTPRLHTDEQISGFITLTEAVHRHGAKIGAQIFYPEYDVEALNAMAASGDMRGIREKLHYDMEHFVDEATEEKLMGIITCMTECAVRAGKAGFDAIQIHGDRLAGVLCSTKMNHRTDRFGGSLENRVRFSRMLVQSIKAAVPHMMIEYKLSIITPETGRGGIDYQDAAVFAGWLQEDGVQLLHVAQANHTGNLADTIPPMGVRPYGFFVEIAGEIRKAANIPVSVVGRIIDPFMAENILESGKADMIAVGRPLLCDPDWGNKIEQGMPERIRRCISCNKGCTDAIQNRSAISCVLNRENGNEEKGGIRQAQTPKKVLIAGGGIAGLEAARVAALRGHEVALYEKSNAFGGQINLASIPPRKMEMKRAVEDLVREASAAGAALSTGTSVTPEMILEWKPDLVLLAIGAENGTLRVPGGNGANVFDAWRVLSGNQTVYGHVAIIGGGLVGCETAEYLIGQGLSVSIIEMQDQIASGESTTILPVMMEHLTAAGTGIHTGATLQEIHADGITYNQKDGTCCHLSCDCVVMAAGARPALFADEALISAGIPVIRIGDCNEVAKDIANAVQTAYEMANSL